MKNKLREFMVKLFSLILAISMCIPTNVYALGINDEDEQMPTMLRLSESERQDNDKVDADPYKSNEKIQGEDSYALSQKASLSEGQDSIIYTIRLDREEASSDDDLILSLATNKNQDLTKLIVKEVKDLSTPSENIDYIEERKDDGDLHTLSIKTPPTSKSIEYTIEAPIHKEGISTDKLYSFDLSLDQAGRNLDLRRISYKFVEEEDENNPSIKNLVLRNIKEKDDSLRKITYNKGDEEAQDDTLTYTDYLISKDKGDEASKDEKKNELIYRLEIDENQDPSTGEITLDYFKAGDKGFDLKKEYSTTIPYTDETTLDLPQGYILKVTYTNKLDKKNTKVIKYSVNGKGVRNPRFVKEEEKSSDNDEDGPQKKQADKNKLTKKSNNKTIEVKSNNSKKALTNLEKADRELKDALKDKNNSLEDIQKLLTRLGEKYKLNKADQEKLMTANDSQIKNLVDKDRKENFRPSNLQVRQGESSPFADKKFKLKTTMKVKATPSWPIPSGWYFDIHLGPYLRDDLGQQIKDLYKDNRLIATAEYLENGDDHFIRYTYVRKVTESIDLDIDQNLAFDTRYIGNQKKIAINIKVAPKNNPVQAMPTIIVSENSKSPVTSEFVVEDKGESKSGSYPYQLDWRTTSQKLKDKDEKEITSLIGPNLDGAYVEWNIEVDTKDLINSKENLTFNNLNLTVFASSNQGLKNFSYKASSNKSDLDSNSGYKQSSRLGELLSQASSITKSELGEKLYIKVKAPIDPDQVHETYSIGFRINPDKNYIDNLLQEYLDKFEKLPTPIKWLKGVENARRFAEVPFNLVETNIPATFLGLKDRFTNERFYYDNTRTLVAKRVSDRRADWYALDLIRRGENQDTSLDGPTFDINNGEREQNIRPKKVYFVPKKEGGYRRTEQAGDVVLSNGQYYPGTLVSYEYENQKATRDDTYNFKVNLKDKKKFNVDEVYDTEGGRIELFTEKVSDQALANGYLAYTEDPYPIMRINKNFDMVSCFNDRVNAPVFTGKNGVFLDIHEDVAGDYLIGRLNESLGNPSGSYNLRTYLTAGNSYDGVYLNHDGMSQGQAMEELMKKIYFYGEEVKKDYSNSHNGEQMHRLIESSMFQRVIHHFTDGKSLEDDYFTAPSSYNMDEWKVEHTLSGIRQTYPKTGWDGSFNGSNPDRKTDQGLRKLRDKETRIKNYPPVQATQHDMAVNLYTKVIASYKKGNDWNADKADSVKLVFYSHTEEGKYQELIAGRVMAPIEIDKFKKDGTKLKGATFRFTNIDNGENKTWTSDDGKQSHKLYLRPGRYKVQEIGQPAGYEKIEDFDLTIKRVEIYPDDGPYKAKKLPSIHVNDGFKTEVVLGDKIPKSVDGSELVKLDGNKIRVSVTNIEDNLGKLEFIKKNKFINLDGAEFRLRKLKDSSVDKAKINIDKLNDTDFDSKYDQTSKGTIGEFKFEQIPVGYYVLEETKVPYGYEKSPSYLLSAEQTNISGKKKVEVNFVGKKLETLKATRDGKVVDLPIIRNYTKKIDIKFRKVRTENLETSKEHLGLGDAKFRLMSLKTVDGDFYLEEAYTDNTTKTEPPRKKVDGQQAEGGGYITFKGLKAGEYLLEELEAPKGYKKTDLYGWKLVVSENKEGTNKGELSYKLYEVPKAGAGENQDKIFNSTDLKKIDISELISAKGKVKAYQIANESRTIDITFKKYKGKIIEQDGKHKVEANEVTNKLEGKNKQPVSFNIYKSDFYGAIIGDKDANGDFIPLNKTPIIQDENGIFHLKGLEFGGYYILRETNPPKDYQKADDILLKVEAEAIANEGKMKVIVRDPNTNAKTDFHSVFEGVVDFPEKEKLGKFSIKKVGNAIGFTDENGNPIRVGLRRAYFRLYTADDNFEILMNGKYPKEYVQKVTPGVPITKEDGKGGQTGKSPKEIADEAPNQGIVTFDQLKPGNYVLEEYRGPAGYEKDPGRWYIVVERNGTVKKYRDNPKTSNKPRQVDYSAQSLRYRSVGLDISAPIQVDRIMQAPTDPGLEEIQPYNIDSENANITVRASGVDTTDGSRDIRVRITPKTKKVGKNKSHWILLVDRSQDYSNKLNNLDNNINKFITDLRAKANTDGAEVYLSIIEYSGNNPKFNKVLLEKTNIKDLDNARDYSYKMGILEPGQFEGQFNIIDQEVGVKDYLEKVGVDKRVGILDGGDRLLKLINENLAKLTSDTYDNKYLINFASFKSKEVKRTGELRGPFYQIEAIKALKDRGYTPVLTHVDQDTTELSPKAQEYKGEIAKNSAYNFFGQTLKQVLANKSYKKARDFAPYVQKDLLDGILNTDSNFTSQGKEESLLKDGKLSIATSNGVKIKSYSISKDGNELESSRQITGSIDKDLSLGVGESLDLTYKVILNANATNNTAYQIHKWMTYRKNPTDTGINLDTRSMVTKKINQEPKTYKVKKRVEGFGSVTFEDTNKEFSEGEDVYFKTHKENGYGIDKLEIRNLATNELVAYTNYSNRYKFKMPAGDVEVYAKFVQKPQTPSYSITINQPVGGRLVASKAEYIKENDQVTLTIYPDTGKKLDKLIVDGNEVSPSGNSYTFKMPAHNIIVSANFVEENTNPQPAGNVDLKTIFTYSNQKDGKDDSNPPEGFAGEIKLLVKDQQVLRTIAGWSQVGPTQKAPYKGELTFPNLDPARTYRLEYTRYEANASLWGTETTTIIDLDMTQAKETEGGNHLLKVTISNGNLIEIFNHDETGFRIPLRITKVNENKAALTGSQFKARKLINGEKVNIYKKNDDGTYTDTGKKGYPKYYDEKFDGVSEATGKPGDNYFRELTPGIYELTEIKMPDETYRPPKDKNGKDMKWYFKVVINKEKVPRDANYMDITFDFEHTFKETDDFNIGISEAEKKDLIGKTIKGFKKGDPDFARYIEEVKDDGRSDPARPDAPYKWIHDARVTNYKNKTSLNFFKKDKNTYQNIEGAEFSLRKAKLDENGSLVLKNNGKPEYAPEITIGADGKALTKEELDSIRVKPYDEKSKFAKAVSKEKLGVEFTNIEAGTYILEEIKPAKGYKLPDSFLTITFTEDKDGSWRKVVTGYEKNSEGKYQKMDEPNDFFTRNALGKFVSINNEKSYIDLKFQKIEGAKKNGKEVPVSSSDFRLTEVDEKGKKLEGGYDKTIYSYANSHFEFKYLAVGRYKLQEIRAIDKFEKPDPWFFKVVQDEKTHKLRIEFDKTNGDFDKSLGFKTRANGEPAYDEDGNLQDLKIRNYSKTNFSFIKLKDEKDKNGNKLPLKDAYFRLKKVRYSMAEGAKTYEYYGEDKNAVLKKYTNGNRITEFTETGRVSTFTNNGKVYKYDSDGNLETVDGNQPSEEDKKVRPDSITSATGKYSALRRSQSDGSVDFQNLGEGIYQLEEVGIPEGYQSDNKQFKWIFEVKKTADGLKVDHDPKIEKEYFQNYGKDYYPTYTNNKFDTKQNIEKVEGDNKYSYKITNTKTTTNLKWKKIGSRSTSDLIKKDTKFILLKTSNKPEDIDSAKSGQSEFPPYQVESSDGSFEIKDLSKGVYVLIETQAPEGYEDSDRKIAIKVYEDKDGAIKKQFYEIDSQNNLLTSAADFQTLLNRNPSKPEVHTDTDGSIYVINKSKPYFFYLSKGFMDKNKFTYINKGKLRIKISKDPADTSNTDDTVYEQIIDLSDAKSYRIDLNNTIQLGKDYLLEEVEAPDGFAKTKYKYRLSFAFIPPDQKFVAILKAVLDEKGKPLTDARGNITESNQYLGKGANIGDGFEFRIINNKTEIKFKKVGLDGKNETPLKNIAFYLEKQDPDDIQTTNQGYYPLTSNMEMIKPERSPQGKTTYYYISKETGKKVTSGVSPENSRKTYTSDEDGQFEITNLTDGYYRIIEPKAPEYEPGKRYMQVQGPIKRFRVVQGRIRIFDKGKDGKIVEKEVDENNISTLGKIVNKKPGKGEFTLTKLDEKGSPLANVKYTLHNTDSEETQVGNDQYTTNSEGKIVFKDLAYGYYWLKESKTKDGYILDSKKKLIALGGGDWGPTPAKKDDISSAITFDGKKEELTSTEDSKRTNVVYPNKAEGMLAKFNFKIDPKITIKAGDYFTINFSDNVDLDGIFKTNEDEGKNPDSRFDIIGPAGKLAEAKINTDRKSITYTFTNYVKDYKPDTMSMLVQLFPDRRKVDHTQDIEVTADIGINTDPDSRQYHYSDKIKIDYRGENEKVGYTGYQNPQVDISSYMLRLDPDGKTFTAIIYYNPWNKTLSNKNITFTTDQDIVVDDSLSVRTYKKQGPGSHPTKLFNGWQEGDLPDSYDIYEDGKSGTVRSDLKLVDKGGDKYKWYPTKTWTEIEEVNAYSPYDYYKYDYNYGKYRYYRYVSKSNSSEKITRQITIPTAYLNDRYANDSTYVIEIKGKLKGENLSSLKTTSYYANHYVYEDGAYSYAHTGSFETWSQFFNPEGLGDARKEIKLVNYKNKIEFAKVDGGVLSNVVDQTQDNPQKLKDLGLGLPLKGAVFKLQKDGADLEGSTRTSDGDGIFSWKGLTKGHYDLYEIKSPDETKYDLPTNPVSSFDVDKDGNIINIKDAKQIIENHRKAKIKIKKTDQNGLTLEGAEFTLTPTSGQKDPTDPQNNFPTKTLKTNAKGIVESDSLPEGKYELKEEKAPATYTKSDKIWQLEVKKDGKIKWLNSFDDSEDEMKKVSVSAYSNDSDKENLKAEIIGIDTKSKTFRQKITIKAKESQLEKARLLVEGRGATLTQATTKVRLVQLGANATLLAKDESTYTVETKEATLTLRITPPYRNKKEPLPLGSSGSETTQPSQLSADEERTYQFIIDMPYKDDTKIGAKLTYDVGEINQSTGHIEFGTKDIKTSLDKYTEIGKLTISKDPVAMTGYQNYYLVRDINLLTIDLANIKRPDLCLKKVDQDNENIGLAGAEFELQIKVGSAYLPIKTDGTPIGPTDTTSKRWTSSSKKDGSFEFSSIPDGEYRIYETQAPLGYVLKDRTVYKFKVDKGKIYEVDKESDKLEKRDLLVGEDKNSATNRIKIKNKKAVYPYTGGEGPWFGYSLLGTITMTLAASYLALKKRQKQKADL